MQHHHMQRHIVLVPTTLRARMYAAAIRPILVFGLIALMLTLFSYVAPKGEAVSFSTIVLAAFATSARLAIAYALSVLIAIPLTLFVTSNPTIESIFLPIFDVLESVPILVLFPVLIIVFVRSEFYNGAAIAILFLTMLWSLVFTLVGGIKIIPKDITYAAHVFGVTGISYVRRIVLPAIVPQFVTGSILALAQGWNIIIVAEVLHTYIPGGTVAQDLFGIGAILVQASASAQTTTFLSAVLVMVVLIAFFNLFVWQRLLHYSQRFKFE